MVRTTQTSGWFRHRSCVGVEFVKADGTVVDCASVPLRKDNTGYALPQLLIGSEGTLGVITRLALAAPPRPSAVSVAWLSCADFDAVRGALALARRHLAEVLSAIEFVDGNALRAVLDRERDLDDPLAGGAARFRVLVECAGSDGAHDGAKLERFLEAAFDDGCVVDGNALRAVLDRERDLADPLGGGDAAFRVLVECAGSDGAHDGAKLERFLEAAFDDGCVVDGVLAPSASKAARLWRLREGVSDSMTAAGFVYKYDVSLPHAHLYRLVDECRDRLAAAGFPDGEEINVAGYGHVGDANLHLNVCDFFGYREPLRAALEPWVFERVAALGGSVSAEHGVGQCKPDYLHLNKPPPALALMAELKRAMDPNLILNPYKVLPPALLDAP